MTYLKIDNNKGYYRLDGNSDSWIELDQFSKNHMLSLVKLATEEQFEMEEYKDELLQNPAHNIIYRNIYAKFKDLLNNKSRFKDTVESMYKAALEKYAAKIED